jgi:hypothetical protein
MSDIMGEKMDKKFKPIDLKKIYNSDWLGEAITKNKKPIWRENVVDFINTMPKIQRTYWGIPFSISNKKILILPKNKTIEIQINNTANYIVFNHFCDHTTEIEKTGEQIADYIIEYIDGSDYAYSVRRRFEVRDPIFTWGLLPFKSKHSSMSCPVDFRDKFNGSDWGWIQTAGRDNWQKDLWLFALRNPEPDKKIKSIRIKTTENSTLAIAGITLYYGKTNPLFHERLNSFVIKLPNNKYKKAKDVPVDIDTGIVARKYNLNDYNNKEWLSKVRGWGEEGEKPKPDTIGADITTNKDSELKVDKHKIKLNKVFEEGKGVSEDGKIKIELTTGARTWVHTKVIDSTNNKPTPVRVHFRDKYGRYIAPYGHRTEVNDYWFQDYGADLKLGATQYAYVDGTFQIELPVGEVFVEITKGFEYKPIRKQINVARGQKELEIKLDRPINLRDKGWITADTHVHFLTPQTAFLEGEAEGVNLINLLASQWGDLFTNVGDITGQASGVSTKDTIVWVGTENRQHLLGHISMLGAKGKPIYPMCASGMGESYFGDPTWSSMSEWAKRCRKKEGLVVAPHFPLPYAEMPAEIVLGKLDAVEIMNCSDFILKEWYRYLNNGYRIPAVGGTDKMFASTVLGGIRTYAYIGNNEFSFESWANAVRSGRTYTTTGPVLNLLVEGRMPGDEIQIPNRDAVLEVNAKAEAIHLFNTIEIVVNGEVTDKKYFDKGTNIGEINSKIKVSGNSWISARCLSNQKWPTVSAHTSPVYVKSKTGKELINPKDLVFMTTLIEGCIEWLDTFSVPASPEQHQHIRNIYEQAKRELDIRLKNHTH